MASNSSLNKSESCCFEIPNLILQVAHKRAADAALLYQGEFIPEQNII